MSADRAADRELHRDRHAEPRLSAVGGQAVLEGRTDTLRVGSGWPRMREAIRTVPRCRALHKSSNDSTWCVNATRCTSTSTRPCSSRNIRTAAARIGDTLSHHRPGCGEAGGTGRIPRGYLGLGLQAVTIEGGGSGVMVMSVDPKGPGAAANIHQGDVLVSWDGKPINKLQPLLRSLGPDSVGRSLAIELRRGGQSHQTKLQIGERPAA